MSAIKRFVPQKAETGDCGASCIAMVCDVTYERVMESVPPDIIPHGLWYAEVFHALKKVSGRDWSIKEFTTTPVRLQDLNFPDEPVILAVTKPEAGYVFHYVAADGFLFYDPYQLEPITVSEAKEVHGKWNVLALIKE